MDKEKIAIFLEDMIDALTFRRVALLALLATITISMLAVFENRSAIFAAVYKTAEPATMVFWELSNESRNQLIGLTNNSLVGSISLVDVDLKKNRRMTKFIHISDPAVAALATKALTNQLPQALFDYDAKNTSQMVAMLNNEFKCDPTADTLNARLFPALVPKYPVTCRIAVPPFFGEFAGYITVLLIRQPTANEFDSLKIEMNRLAIETYLRDISKKPVI